MPLRLAAVAFAGLAALAIAMGIGRFAFTPILPMMLADAGVGLVEGGWLASANYGGYLAGALSAVALRMPPARAIHLGLALVAASTLAMGFTSAMAPWLVLRAVAGLASAWVLVYASAWCLERFETVPGPGQRARLGATVFAGVGVGIAAAGAICVALSRLSAPSPAAWLALGAVATLGAAAIWPRFGSVADTASPARPPRLAWTAETVRMVACYGMFGFGYIIPATFLAAMARTLAPDPAVYGWAWPAFGAAAAASTFAAALLRRRLSERALWIAGHLVMAVGVVMPLAWPGIAGIVASALLVGGTFMVVTMVGMQEARRVAGAAARPLIAAMTSAFAAGQIAGPLAVSALAALGTGYAPALLLAGALLVASALALVPFPHRRSP
jgi:predicted MFS family arabinose efflux permease